MIPQTPPARPRRLRLIRKLTFATILVALYAVIAIPPAAAQTAQNELSGKRAPAVLHIQAQIVPVAYTPSPRTAKGPVDSAIVYSLPARQGAMTMVEEIRIVSRGEIVAWLGDRAVQAAVLKTMTFVSQ